MQFRTCTVQPETVQCNQCNWDKNKSHWEKPKHVDKYSGAAEATPTIFRSLLNITLESDKLLFFKITSCILLYFFFYQYLFVLRFKEAVCCLYAMETKKLCRFGGGERAGGGESEDESTYICAVAYTSAQQPSLPRHHTLRFFLFLF